jgi:hypothetical protein
MIVLCGKVQNNGNLTKGSLFWELNYLKPQWCTIRNKKYNLIHLESLYRDNLTLFLSLKDQYSSAINPTLYSSIFNINQNAKTRKLQFFGKLLIDYSIYREKFLPNILNNKVSQFNINENNTDMDLSCFSITVQISSKSKPTWFMQCSCDYTVYFLRNI